jgi:two-component system, OmpR family, phosphate regulon sensor histidine kinase PhoR
MDLDISSWAREVPRERQIPRAVLATIGHELRTPLTSIRGYVETLLDGDFDAQTARRFLETVRREALRLGRLVDGMLEFSLLDLSSSEKSVVCNLGEQIRATIEMLSPIADERGATIRARLPDAAFARVDGDACVRALSNLIENAIKHGGEEATVEVSCAPETPYVAIAVDDDGRGVAPDSRETIFLMGVRGEAARAGCGIGLAIVKGIAERAGGDVRVETSSLGGARFVLRFLEG